MRTLKLIAVTAFITTNALVFAILHHFTAFIYRYFSASASGFYSVLWQTLISHLAIAAAVGIMLYAMFKAVTRSL
ncbi:hypothetical protein [Shewanella waksmanii]|uniref:hypothetical protein n=1 Tax=Shewanella waksmanii TaxID=213783 RepID=UPI003735D8E7